MAESTIYRRKGPAWAADVAILAIANRSEGRILLPLRALSEGISGVVIFGLEEGLTILGHKRDECAGCGAIGTHVVVRKTYWVHIFWAPLLLVWLRHGMICEACGEWTGLSWRQVRRAMNTGVLPLERTRPAFAAARPTLADDFGRLPNVPQYFDPFEINPKRGFWDTYLKLWLGAAIAVVALVAVAIVVT